MQLLKRKPLCKAYLLVQIESEVICAAGYKRCKARVACVTQKWPETVYGMVTAQSRVCNSFAVASLYAVLCCYLPGTSPSQLPLPGIARVGQARAYSLQIHNCYALKSGKSVEASCGSAFISTYTS